MADTYMGVNKGSVEGIGAPLFMDLSSTGIVKCLQFCVDMQAARYAHR
jgi:hypothetical protein